MGFPGSMVRVESDYYSTRSVRTTSESDQSQPDQFPVWGGSQDDLGPGPGTDGGCISFAKIAKGKPISPKPSNPLPRSSSFPTPTWTSLGSVQPLAARTRPTPLAESDGEPEPEGYVPPPERASLGDTLAAALQVADTTNINSNTNGGGGGKKGKKGRGKQILVTGELLDQDFKRHNLEIFVLNIDPKSILIVIIWRISLPVFNLFELSCNFNLMLCLKNSPSNHFKPVVPGLV